MENSAAIRAVKAQVLGELPLFLKLPETAKKGYSK
jgi:hypothetical protein